MTVLLGYRLLSLIDRFDEMKIQCEFEERCARIFFKLSLCDGNNRELECIWSETINPNLLDDEEKDLLTLANGTEFDEQEEWFDQLKELSRRLHNHVYNPSQPFDAEEVTRLHSDMFRILGEKLFELEQ